MQTAVAFGLAFPSATWPCSTGHASLHLRSVIPSSFYLYHHLDFHGNAKGELIHAYCRTSMSTALAIQCYQEIGGAVYDFRLVWKVFRTVDEAQNFDDTLQIGRASCRERV